MDILPYKKHNANLKKKLKDPKAKADLAKFLNDLQSPEVDQYYLSLANDINDCCFEKSYKAIQESYRLDQEFSLENEGKEPFQNTKNIPLAQCDDTKYDIQALKRDRLIEAALEAPEYFFKAPKTYYGGRHG